MRAKYNFYVHPESMCAKNIVLIVFILALRFGIKLSKDCSDAGMEEHSRLKMTMMIRNP